LSAGGVVVMSCELCSLALGPSSFSIFRKSIGHSYTEGAISARSNKRRLKISKATIK
jgi:hypothetical protein